MAVDSRHSSAGPGSDRATHLQRAGLAADLLSRSDRGILFRSILWWETGSFAQGR